jgi:hypothetical protein
VLVSGNSVRYPLGPLSTMSSDALRGAPSEGSIEDAVDLAIAELERTDGATRVIYVYASLDMEQYSRLRERARESRIDFYTWNIDIRPHNGSRVVYSAGGKRPTSEAQLTLPSEPSLPSRWPAVALLLVAAALARRSFTA